MKKIFSVSIRLSIFLVLISIDLMAASEIFAAPDFTGPQFRPGEVVVAGTPGPHLEGLEVVKYLPHANITVVKVAAGKELATAQRFKAHGRKAGLNNILHALYAPGDIYYPYQWNFSAVQSEQAWEISSGEGVTVAVLDTGLAVVGREDGIHCVVSGTDIVNGDNDPFDGNGHGTHVSGTIAQKTGNGIGVAGLAYNACIMPVKVLGDNGLGTSADIAEGISYAVDNGAKVINLSLGFSGQTNDATIDTALDNAYLSNVTVVCASGNDGSHQQVSYPAIYPTTIAVGATDFNNDVAGYSNRGEGLDIVAPGGDIPNGPFIFQDGILQETLLNGSWDYWFYDGTSMASPHVAATAAMLLAVNPLLSPDTIYQILTTTALDLNQTGYDSTSGYGLVQAYDALTSLLLDETDTDGDGMTDNWELYHGLDPGDPSDALNDPDLDGLTNLDEFTSGTDPFDPDTDNDGINDGFDGYPLDDQQSSCGDLVKNYSTQEVFLSIQGAVNDPDANDYDMIQITAADFAEDLVYDRNTVMTLSGGFYCSYSDNPSASSISSLKIINGTVIIENLTIR